jgi:chemotaxis signal transduction protein
MALTGQEVAGTEQLVVFKLAQEEFAVPIQVVQEIVRSPELTEVRTLRATSKGSAIFGAIFCPWPMSEGDWE